MSDKFVQWTGDNEREVLDLTGTEGWFAGLELHVNTGNGVVVVNVSDWIAHDGERLHVFTDTEFLLKAIAENPEDTTLRGAFADWLDEHGEPEEAAQYRECERRGSWIVRMKVERTVEIVCEGCTEEEAWNNPYDFAVGEETEIDQWDCTVDSVEPNE